MHTKLWIFEKPDIQDIHGDPRVQGIRLALHALGSRSQDIPRIVVCRY